MRSVLQRRPSPSIVVSLVALVVAMSGTAVAGVRLVSGDALIRKGSLSGNRLRRHTITGRQINFRRLGVVPRARTAGYAARAGYAASAGSASSATNATNAVNAQNAANAGSLGGQPASSFLTTGSRIGTNGIVRVAGSASGTTVTLFSHGPFTVTMTCTMSGNLTSVSIDATSSEAGSVLQGHPGVSSANLDSTNYSQGALVGGGTYTLEAPSGAALVVGGSFGINSLGIINGCWANFAGIA